MKKPINNYLMGKTLLKYLFIVISLSLNYDYLYAEESSTSTVDTSTKEESAASSTVIDKKEGNIEKENVEVTEPEKQIEEPPTEETQKNDEEVLTPQSEDALWENKDISDSTPNEVLEEASDTNSVQAPPKVKYDLSHNADWLATFFNRELDDMISGTDSEEGQRIYLRTKAFINEGSNKGLIIIVSGFQHPIEVYIETAKDFYLKGYSVVMYDPRGQGKSTRFEGYNKGIAYVDDFNNYVKDLDLIYKYANDKFNKESLPVYIYGHSMGGLVASLFVEEFKRDNILKGMILTAPMYEMKTNYVPSFIVYLAAKIYEWLGLSKESAWFKDGKHDENYYNGKTLGTSSPNRVLFFKYLWYNGGVRFYTDEGISWKWIFEAIENSYRRLDEKKMEVITSKVPTIIFYGTEDRLVWTGVYDKYCNIERGCITKKINGAAHSIHREEDEYRNEFLRESFLFMDRQKNK